MNNEDMLLKAVLANPNEDTPRLMLADAVQERDETLAELIRVGVPCGCISGNDVRFGQIGCGPCQGRGWLHRCGHEGCREGGRECVIQGMSSGEPDDIIEFFCGDHAAEHGYCPVCGSFWGGISTFEENRICDHCRDQIEADFDEQNEWEDEDYDGFHYPDE